MTSFALIHNPIVAFVDNDEDYDYFRSLRRHFDVGLTCLVRLERSRMWAFSAANRRRVRDITGQDDYPQFYPNTIIEDYSLTQNAKYEVIYGRSSLFRCIKNAAVCRTVSTNSVSRYHFVRQTVIRYTLPAAVLRDVFCRSVCFRFLSRHRAICELYTHGFCAPAELCTVKCLLFLSYLICSSAPRSAAETLFDAAPFCVSREVLQLFDKRQVYNLRIHLIA